MTISIIWNDDNNNDMWAKFATTALVLVLSKSLNTQENDDEYFWEVECEFCFGTGYEGGMN